MELHYQVTGDDYRAHVKHVSRKVNRTIRPWLSFAVMIGALIFVTVLANHLYPRLPSGNRDPRRDIVLVVGAVIAIVGSTSLLRWSKRRFVDQQISVGPTVVDVTLALQPDGIATQSSTGHGLTYWHAVKGVEDAGQYILIRTGIVSQIIIPKRAFQDAQHVQVFLGELQRLWHAAAGSPDSQPFPSPPQPGGPSTPPAQ